MEREEQVVVRAREREKERACRLERKRGKRFNELSDSRLVFPSLSHFSNRPRRAPSLVQGRAFAFSSPRARGISYNALSRQHLYQSINSRLEEL